MTPKQQRFVEEYLVDLNATQAAIRAGYSKKTANEQAARLLANVSVQAAVAAARASLSERTEITQSMVLTRWWQIATADPNELIQFRRTCCRYCHGDDHAWQWRDAEEYAQAIAGARAAGKPDPSDNGGYGFSSIADPHPTCRECEGEGVAMVHALDTRKLRGGARMLYAGVKQTKEGFEVKMQDQGKALENVARHLGMFKELHEHTGKGGGPIQTADVTTDKLIEEAKRLGIDPALLGIG